MTIPSQWADGAFEKFLEDFLDPLAASTFSDDGNLSAYLEMPAEYRGIS